MRFIFYFLLQMFNVNTIFIYVQVDHSFWWELNFIISVIDSSHNHLGMSRMLSCRFD
jgi:hypothetical protein